MAFGYCRRLRLRVCVRARVYVCVSVNHGFVRITCHPLKLQSPKLDRRCKTHWLRYLLFFSSLTLTFKVKLNLKVKIYPILGL